MNEELFGTFLPPSPLGVYAVCGCPLSCNSLRINLIANILPKRITAFNFVKFPSKLITSFDPVKFPAKQITTISSVKYLAKRITIFDPVKISSYADYDLLSGQISGRAGHNLWSCHSVKADHEFGTVKFLAKRITTFTILQQLPWYLKWQEIQ